MAGRISALYIYASASIFVAFQSRPHCATGSTWQERCRAPTGKWVKIHEFTGLARRDEGHRSAVLRDNPRGAMERVRRESRICDPRTWYRKNGDYHNALYMKQLQNHNRNQHHTMHDCHGILPPFFLHSAGRCPNFPSYQAVRAYSRPSARSIFMRIFRTLSFGLYLRG